MTPRSPDVSPEELGREMWDTAIGRLRSEAPWYLESIGYGGTKKDEVLVYARSQFVRDRVAERGGIGHQLKEHLSELAGREIRFIYEVDLHKFPAKGQDAAERLVESELSLEVVDAPKGEAVRAADLPDIEDLSGRVGATHRWERAPDGTVLALREAGDGELIMTPTEVREHLERRPRRSRHETRDDPILARSIAQVEQDAPSYLKRRFPPAVHMEDDGQIVRGFEHPEGKGPCLPLHLYRLGGGAAIERGRGVPIALRFFVEAVLSVPLWMRSGIGPVLLNEVRLHEVLRWLYGDRVPSPSRYWPALLEAINALNHMDARVPWQLPDGTGGARQVVSFPDVPRSGMHLNDLFRVQVHLPPGDGNGPPMDRPRLRYWAMRCAANYRALIALNYNWYIEGKRVLPPRGRRKIGLQIRHPKKYDLLTDDTAVNYCYPSGTGKAERSKRVRDARDNLTKLVDANDAGLVEDRLLPPCRAKGTSQREEGTSQREEGASQREEGASQREEGASGPRAKGATTS